MSQLEEAIANLTLKFHVKSMKELFLIILEEERKGIYMQYLKEELKDMVENLKRGSASAKNLHEKVLKLRRKLQPEREAKPFSWQSEKLQGTNGETIMKIKEVQKPYKITGVKNKLAKMIKGTQKLIEKIEDGRLYNSENEHVKRILLQLEQKLVQTLRDLQRWVEEVKTEKAQELHDKVHRTSIMIQQSIETGYNAFDINGQRD